MRRPLVVIESPLGAATREAIETNKAYAREAMLDSLKRGEAPYASHLLFDQPGLLDDTNAKDRQRGMEVGEAWSAKADLCAVYLDLGVSEGMQRGIDAATVNRIPIDYRKIR